MTLGRQSKRGKIALGLIGALLCALMVAPAGALAAGDCEYCVDIPGGDGNGQDPTANASGGSGDSGGDSSGDGSVAPTDTGTVTTPTTDTGTTDDSSDDSNAGGAGGGKGGDGNDKAVAGNGGDRHQDSLAPKAEPGNAVTTSSSDDGGGFPVILVAIAVLAAAGVGFAAWRARRGDGMGSPAQTGSGA
jgi:hypothetical protein